MGSKDAWMEMMMQYHNTDEAGVRKLMSEKSKRADPSKRGFAANPQLAKELGKKGAEARKLKRVKMEGTE